MSVVMKYAMTDSVTGLAFGPVFETAEDGEAFQEHLEAVGERDPRVIPALELAELHREWMEERDE